ncbi:MAG: ABC transporter permease [Phycisphaeraceae bacterium]|nr:ABC transporter permease [Phycisphaeraceae bacterium]
MILNPVIQRELVGTLRTPRTIILMVLLVAVLGLVLVVRWPSDAQVSAVGERSAAQALDVLRVFGFGALAAILLMSPAFAAVSVVREKQGGTLALLLNSPLSPAAIYLGKLVASMGLVVVLLALMLPLGAASFAMGGVSFGAIAGLYLVLILAALQYSTLGLWVSCHASGSDSSLRLTYGGVLVLAVLSLGPHQFAGAFTGVFGSEVLDWIRSLSSITAVGHLLGVELGAGVMRSDADLSGRFMILAVISSVVFAALTLRRLSQRMLDTPRPTGKVTDDRSTSQQAFRRFLFLWFFDPSRRSELIGPLVNPVMIKEFRSRRFGRSGWLLRMIAFCLVASLGLMLLASYSAGAHVAAEYRGIERLGGIIVLLQTALVVLLTPALAAGLISQERESGGWYLLQLTVLSPWRIVLGKLLSVGVVLLLILVATLPGYAVLVVADLNRALRVLDVVVTLSLTALFALLLSATVSSLFKRTATATAVSYGALVGLCGGTMLFWLAEGSPFNRSTVETALAFNPVAAALQVIESPGFTDYRLVPFNWWFLIFASLGLLVILTVRTWRLTRPQ